MQEARERARRQVLERRIDRGRDGQFLGGACEGEAIECHDFAREDECNKQRGCRFSGGSCERRNSLFWEKNAACAELSNAMHALELNPEVARSSCLQSYGCRWVHEDGREELAHDGDMPAIRPDAAPPPG